MEGRDWAIMWILEQTSTKNLANLVITTVLTELVRKYYSIMSSDYFSAKLRKTTLHLELFQ